MVDTPPSLHRYLYAYANPTVYIDLTGYAATEAEREAAQRYVEEQRKIHEQQIQEQNEVAQEVNQRNKERIASGEYMTQEEADARREERRKTEEAQKEKVVKESEREVGSVDEVTEEYRQYREKVYKPFKEFGEGAATTADVIDAFVAPETTDFIPGAVIVGVIKDGKKVYKAISKEKGGADAVKDLGSTWKSKDITNSKNWNGCEQCALDIQSKIGGDVVRIKPMDGAPSLGGYKGTNPGWAHHEVVVKDGRVYDAFGPSNGLPIDEYKAQFQYPDAIDFGF